MQHTQIPFQGHPSVGRTRSAPRILAAGACSLAFAASSLLTSCGKSLPSEMQIESSRVLPKEHRSGIPTMGMGERLGLSTSSPHGSMGSGGAMGSGGSMASSGSGAARPTGLGYDIPEGWKRGNSSQFRLVNLVMAGDPSVSLYVTRLGGDGGGYAQNFARWCGQVGAQPLSQSLIDQLPTLRFLGMDGKLALIEGEKQQMLAAIAIGGGEFWSVKLKASAAIVKRERDHFLQFVKSLRKKLRSAAPKSVAGARQGTSKAPAGPNRDPQSLRWTAPPSWEKGHTSSMRIATYYPGGDKSVELSVIVLGGTGGGVVGNIQRWYTQLNLAPPSEQAVGQLPKLKVLGFTAPMMDATGSYAGMSSGAGTPDTTMLGVICLQPSWALFFKMVGPKEKVAKHKKAFRDFCTSFRYAN